MRRSRLMHRAGGYCPHESPRSAPLVFYFGGNAEDVAASSLTLAGRLDVNLAVFPYRGYAGRAGAPTEDGLFEDALAAYDAVVDLAVHDGRKAVLGRSLGSGVAVYLASQRPIDRLALVTPYDSITNVARGHYPWLPVRWLLKYPFDSASRADQTPVPLLIPGCRARPGHPPTPCTIACRCLAR